MQVPLDELPEIGDPDGRDDAELIWAPLDDDDDEEEAGEEADEDRAAFLRKWASLDYEHESLMSLYHAGNDAERAEEAMATLAAEAPSQRTLGQEAGLGALMSAEIIEHRKDLYRAQKSIVKKVSASAGRELRPAQPTADPQFLFLSRSLVQGHEINLNQLQRFYYSQWRISSEATWLSEAMALEGETEDGLDDHCAICGQRGLLVC
jgi:hypothetical protein